MKRLAVVLAAAVAVPAFAAIAHVSIASAQRARLLNPAIDMETFLSTSVEAARHRESRRLGESEFKRLAAEPGTIVLDARSKELFEKLHIAGAVNLSFPDIAIDSLERVIPDKTTRVLIYCNNNFLGDTRAFPSKLPQASLNLSTYIALYSYGYRNIYELGPLLDVKTSTLPLVSGQ